MFEFGGFVLNLLVLNDMVLWGVCFKFSGLLKFCVVVLDFDFGVLFWFCVLLLGIWELVLGLRLEVWGILIGFKEFLRGVVVRFCWIFLWVLLFLDIFDGFEVRGLIINI